MRLAVAGFVTAADIKTLRQQRFNDEKVVKLTFPVFMWCLCVQQMYPTAGTVATGQIDSPRLE